MIACGLKWSYILYYRCRLNLVLYNIDFNQWQRKDGSFITRREVSKLQGKYLHAQIISNVELILALTTLGRLLGMHLIKINCQHLSGRNANWT